MDFKMLFVEFTAFFYDPIVLNFGEMWICWLNSRENLHKSTDDVEMGRCMQILGVMTGDSRDPGGFITFHTDKPEDYLIGPIPGWLYEYDKYPPVKVFLIGTWSLITVDRISKCLNYAVAISLLF